MVEGMTSLITPKSGALVLGVVNDWNGRLLVLLRTQELAHRQLHRRVTLPVVMLDNDLVLGA